MSSLSVIEFSGYHLKGLSQINVLLGKNGCGKSTLLKSLEKDHKQNGISGLVKYISPERGGYLSYEPQIEHSIGEDPSRIANSRRNNQVRDFKMQSAVQYKKLQLKILLRLEDNVRNKKKECETFDGHVNSINSLLENVQIERTENLFKIISKSGKEIKPHEISSGESELISLAIECLIFDAECEMGEDNYLLFDEPDVHLHPDIQGRLAIFIKERIRNSKVIIATHSTAFLASIAEGEGVSVVFMKAGEKTLHFKPVSQVISDILPVFGAHPLSNVFNQLPVLLVEGEDDFRVWQQALRSSNGKLKVYPCVTESVDAMKEYEQQSQAILGAVYDNPVGYSIRDGDGKVGELTDLPPLVRMRLDCYAIENLLITDEVLAQNGTSWDDLVKKIDDWIQTNPSHAHIGAMRDFKSSGYDRKKFKIKEVRNDILSLMGVNKSWEIVVGLALAKLKVVPSPSENSLQTFLGKKVISTLFKGF